MTQQRVVVCLFCHTLNASSVGLARFAGPIVLSGKASIATKPAQCDVQLTRLSELHDRRCEAACEFLTPLL